MTDVLSRPQRPQPVVDELTAPYWAAAVQGRLVIRRCSDCGRFRNPPSPICPDCHSESATWTEVSGRGTVYQYTVLRQPRVGGFESVIPYACIVVELDEQPGLLFVANLVDADVDVARVGLRVQVQFEPLEDGLKLPQFAPMPT